MSSAAESHPNPWAESLPKPVEELGTYLANLPDFKQSKRLEIRPVHLEHAKVAFDKGWLVAGGPTFEEEAGSKMTGSWMLCRAVSKDAALERLSKDVYAVHGAWDMNAATITAVGQAKH